MATTDDAGFRINPWVNLCRPTVSAIVPNTSLRPSAVNVPSLRLVHATKTLNSGRPKKGGKAESPRHTAMYRSIDKENRKDQYLDLSSFRFARRGPMTLDQVDHIIDQHLRNTVKMCSTPKRGDCPRTNRGVLLFRSRRRTAQARIFPYPTRALLIVGENSSATAIPTWTIFHGPVLRIEGLQGGNVSHTCCV